MTDGQRPFAADDVSLGLYLHAGDRDLRVLREQARRAVGLGFSGVTLAEHHNERAGYVGNPLLIAATLLPELPTGWVAAAPTILGLRDVRTLAEDALWLEAMFPGRVGLAVGAGFDRSDFDIVGRPFEGRMARFREDAAALARARIDHPEFARPAMGELPLLVATRGPRNVAFAARNGLGLLLPPLPRETTRTLVDDYTRDGGSGPVAVARWVWLGDPPTGAMTELNDAIAATAGDLSWRDSDSILRVVAASTADELADRLVGDVLASGGTHLHLRIHLPGLEAPEVDEQIEAIAREVLPLIRAQLARRAAEVAGTPHGSSTGPVTAG